MINIQKTSNLMGIYMLINLINGKIYIGKAINLQERIKSYQFSKEKRYINSSIRKHGWENFEVEIVAEFEIIDNIELLALETAYIDFFNSIDKNIGYNICLFSNDQTGIKVNQETKDKISKNSAKLSGKNHPMFGKHHSEESKKKISLAFSKEKHPLWGKHHSEETKEKMSKTKLGKYKGKDNWNYGKIMSEEQKQNLREKRKTQNMSTHFKPIKQINKDTGEVIKTWNSIIEATKFFNLKNKSPIWCALNNFCHTSCGFKWAYVNNKEVSLAYH